MTRLVVNKLVVRLAGHPANKINNVFLRLFYGGYIEDIQSFGMNMPFISSSGAKNAYFMSGEATNEVYIFSLHEMK